MKKITKAILYPLIVLALINMGACKKLSSFDYPPSTASALDIISADNSFSYFKFAIDKSGLKDLLSGMEEYTVFAPTDAAFINAGYPLATLQGMPGADVTVLVKNHIVPGKLDIKTIMNNQEATALSGLKIIVQKIGNLNYANGGDILNISMVTTNGFLNTINTLLASRATLNDAITANASFTYLAAAITRASTGNTNFTSLLKGTTAYTLLAPTNAAFIDGGYATIASINAADPDVLGNKLKYHLITGARFTTAFDSVPVAAYNGTPIYFDKTNRNITSTVTLATNVTLWHANGIYFGNNVPSNILAENGVMHTVSRLLPTPVATTTLARISSDSNLTMFYALIQRASTADPNFNFANILADPSKSYTVYAVNNTGLINAGYANVAAINAQDPVVLAKILKLHMVPKRINNISVADNGTINTLLAPATITVLTSGGYKVKGPSNSASIPVITSNVVTTSGLLNIIGSMLTA